jgi:catechol 2,3-dioxygenase-like lactoylglutathione lyase family enzyme
VGIVVKNLEKTINFYVENLGCLADKIHDFDTVFEKNRFRFSYARVGNDYLEIIEPKEGPFFDLLEEKGDGTVAEICFEVDDIEKFYDEMKKKGILLTDMDEKPLINKKYVGSPTGNKFAYFPRELTSGTWVEVIQRAWR